MTMRKITFSIPMTLDGYIEGPQHELDWVIADDELHDFYARLLGTADLILYGRVTYQLMLSYWPGAPSNPQLTGGMLRFAQALNPMRKVVYSKTLKEAGWNTEVISSLVPEQIKQLKAQPGRDILLGGGAAIAQQFMRLGLIDEYQLVIMPVAIGHGKALFGAVSGRPKLALQWSQVFTSGAVVLCYRPEGVLEMMPDGPGAASTLISG
jgi:dihydrofolate reductase